MTIAVAISALPRAAAMAGFRPAFMTADSFVYMNEAVSGRLGTIRPSGYPMFLGLFTRWPAALTVVIGLQHLMGIAIAVIVYALLRRYGLPGWAATLAALPVLFDPREIALESYILPDTLFCLVVVVAVALLMLAPRPRLWQCSGAGLLLAYAALLRGNGVLLIAVAAAFALARRVGWRALLAGFAAFAVPLAAYAVEYHDQHGPYNLTGSDGMFLWSRTTSFANCAIIRPPADLRPLCPAREAPAHEQEASPSWSVSNRLIQGSPADYLWAADAWWRHDASPGFSSRNNRLGLDFALDAIEKQPLGYLRSVGQDVALLFIGTDRPQDQFTMSFTPAPRVPVLPVNYRTDLRQYAGATQNTRAVYPYASWVFGYEQPVWFPGLVFLLVVLIGLAAVAADWRRLGGPQFLPWAMAVALIVSPAALTQTLYRYALAAVPLACLAAGMGWMRLRALRAERTARLRAAHIARPTGEPSAQGPAILP
jgi:4-amino-4-deoxy-L-arabinose transferase-like glycosyltransferase